MKIKIQRKNFKFKNHIEFKNVFFKYEKIKNFFFLI